MFIQLKYTILLIDGLGPIIIVLFGQKYKMLLYNRLFITVVYSATSLIQILKENFNKS